MRALITNDDGVDSAGIALLARVALDAGLDVVVAAPHEERSGASASLTGMGVDDHLGIERTEIEGLRGVEVYAVQASPALIAFVATRGAFGDPPDVVLSGINHGPNTGAAVLHSGTVGAALTALTHGVPAMALS
ncbi:MAG: 5'/3'-nucleotidase SurE, partial [Rhodococcus sp. (in: high G+C Gram-positive bacteria)]